MTEHDTRPDTRPDARADTMETTAPGLPPTHDNLVSPESQLETRPLRTRREQIIAALIFAGTTVVVALVGGLVTSGGQDWFDDLDDPFLAPPDGVFSIVWTALYVLIAVAGFLAWQSTDRRTPTVLWAVQMALNLSWSVVFFGLESVGGGVLVVGALLGVVLIATLEFWRVRPLAGALFLPYFLWLAFAFMLNSGYAAENFG
jgi:translocator protein